MKRNGPTRLTGSRPIQKFRRYRHQRDHRQILVDRGDPCCHGVARAVESDRLAVDEDLAVRRLVNARHGLDEGGLARAVVAEQAMAFAGKDVQ